LVFVPLTDGLDAGVHTREAALVNIRAIVAKTRARDQVTMDVADLHHGDLDATLRSRVVGVVVGLGRSGSGGRRCNH